jgi:hypothetical protein
MDVWMYGCRDVSAYVCKYMYVCIICVCMCACVLYVCVCVQSSYLSPTEQYAWDAVKDIVERLGAENVYIVSKAKK